ncbi:MAG: class I SAM-dependent methyltransferase [Candidatus Omnitrophota bacterium]
MRIFDLEKDRRFYDEEHKPPGHYRKDALDLWRFGLLRGLLRKIFKRDEPFKDRHVLNVAGGWGREAHLILGEGARHLTFCDYSHTQALYAEGYLEGFYNKTIICGDGERLPFKDKSVDICVIAEGLHHFSDPVAGAKEMLRVARSAVIFDEPAGGIFRYAINRLFIALGMKEMLERGYLQEYRMSSETLRELRGLYAGALYFPYFIYYFGWYKSTKNMLLRKIYQVALSVFNIFFHSFGNRVIVVLSLAKREHI